MKKIIIFSNHGKLYSVDEDFASRTDIAVLGASPILFSETGNAFSPVSNFSANGLYFVFDGMEETTFNNLIGKSDKSGFYILLHSEPKYVTGFKNVAEGRNASKENGGKIYPDVVSILEDKEGKKLDRVVKAIFKTDPIQEAKMKLKNEILKGNIPEKVVDELKEFQSALDDFRKFKDEHFLSTEYTNAFSKFLSDLKMEE